MKRNNLIFYNYFIICFILLSFFFINAKPNKDQIFMTITSQEAFKMINQNLNNPDLIILDVRTKKEFISGHIEKAINIDFYDENFSKIIEKLDKNATYLIYCRTGNRSLKAAKIMKDLGFKKIYDFGGINQWLDAGYPVIK